MLDIMDYALRQVFTIGDRGFLPIRNLGGGRVDLNRQTCNKLVKEKNRKKSSQSFTYSFHTAPEVVANTVQLIFAQFPALHCKDLG